MTNTDRQQVASLLNAAVARVTARDGPSLYELEEAISFTCTALVIMTKMPRRARLAALLALSTDC